MSLHSQIMDLPWRAPSDCMTPTERMGYSAGHRDARHAAAELANEADAEISRLRDTQRVLVEALREARGFVSSDYTGSSGRDMSGGALARIDAALASVEQQQEPSKTPFRLDPPPVYDQHYAATQADEEPWPFTGCTGPLTDCDMDDAAMSTEPKP